MLARASLLSFLLLSTVRCESGYDARPTACDDWCQATQRAGCAEDWPHECVWLCTNIAYPGAVQQGCESQWQELLACYQHARDDQFFCRADLSEPKTGVCATEQSRLGRCMYPVWQSCIDACFTLANHCEEFDFNACSQWCVALPPSCVEAVTYHDCLIENVDRCDVLAPECAESRARAVLCPGELVPETGMEP